MDYQHLNRHNVPTRLYPKDAIYSEAPLSFLQKYKFHILAAVSLQCLLITGIVMRLRLFIQKQKQHKREYQPFSQYRKLVDNMPEIYIRKQIFSGGDFIFKDVNPAFENVFGCQTKDSKKRR